MKGITQRVEQKQGSKGPFTKVTVDGNLYYVYRPDVALQFVVGAETEFETTKSAIGQDVVNVAKLTLPAAKPSTAPIPAPHPTLPPLPESKSRFDKDGQSIEAQVALKAVVELIVADKITLDQAEETFTKFQKLLAKRVEHGT